MKKNLIIFTDIGDTVIDEGTEIRRIPQGIVYHADCIPEARETMLSLYEQGYTIVMVADGLTQSFCNTMKENGLDHIFSGWIISEQVGAETPDFRMFEAAMKQKRTNPGSLWSEIICPGIFWVQTASGLPLSISAGLPDILQTQACLRRSPITGSHIPQSFWSWQTGWK